MNPENRLQSEISDGVAEIMAQAYEPKRIRLRSNDYNLLRAYLSCLSGIKHFELRSYLGLKIIVDDSILVSRIEADEINSLSPRNGDRT